MCTSVSAVQARVIPASAAPPASPTTSLPSFQTESAAPVSASALEQLLEHVTDLFVARFGKPLTVMGCSL